MKPEMTSLLLAASTADPTISVRLACNLDTGEYATYLNFNGGSSNKDERGHYFQCEGAAHLAHKFATDDFFKRLETGV